MDYITLALAKDYADQVAAGGGSGSADLKNYYKKSEVDSKLDEKVDKIEGKSLSTNDYTTEEKTKLASLENYNDEEIKASIALKASKEDIPTKTSQLTNDSFSERLIDGAANGSIRLRSAFDNGADKVLGQFAVALGEGCVASGENSFATGYTSVATDLCAYAEGYENIASGSSSHAEGGYTKASGENSHAEGGYSIASGVNSHAEGYETKAANDQAHAEGFHTTASGIYSHSEGHGSEATGETSHAEGRETKASATYAHAEGYKSEASGKAAHAEGDSCKATAQGSHAEGVGSEASGASSHAEGFSYATEMYSHAEGQWTNARSNSQHVQGKYNISDSKDVYAHIVGNGKSTKRSNAHTLDWDGNAWFAGEVYVGSTEGINKDSGSVKLAKITDLDNKVDKIEGKDLSSNDFTTELKTKLENLSSYDDTTIKADIEKKANSEDVYTKDEVDLKVSSVYRYKGSVANKEALPTENLTTGDVYNLEDTGMNVAYTGEEWDDLGSSVDLTSYYTKTEVDNLPLIKGLIYDNKYSSLRFSGNTTTSGNFSTALGSGCSATNYGSFSEGLQSTASGLGSHSEGRSTTASGENSHAEGYMSVASGSYTHAEGSYTTASGASSHAEGNGTTAKSNYQHAQGKYNIVDTANTYAHIIGNGTNTSTRSNAHTVDWEGNAWFSGDVYTGSTSGTNKDDGSKKLATEDFVNTSIENKVDSDDVYTKSEIDTKIGNIETLLGGI